MEAEQGGRNQQRGEDAESCKNGREERKKEDEEKKERMSGT